MKNLSVILLFSLLCSCGYRMGTLMPKGIETICVPTFTNTTLFRDFEFILTPAVVDEILVKTSLNVTNEYQAQTKLIGSIIDVNFRSVIKNDNRNVDVLDITVTARIEWIDLRTGRDVIPKTNVRHRFEVNFIRGENLADETDDGLRDLARKIIYTMESPVMGPIQQYQE
ncbi:LPS assembly lipoprotein LptE [Candidatus Uabimicrobium amorphum]|uniref:LPS-assembly lipoprotein LptE n=1 Tax=Uabimicrobium amorphum TaxID=2596890 RepID=A0A5S9F420_UABAM|nr:LPS assembly lipoprotein LptE [Candidatus Uabimicrobium amorphum]BBM84004.1 hypothetical protein UABAM_02359 [Candidatus Uabimicrobium amorphum]